MTQPVQTPQSLHVTRKTIRHSFDFSPSQMVAAIRKALLFWLASGALAGGSQPTLAQTSQTGVNVDRDASSSGEMTTLPIVTVKAGATVPTYPGGQLGTRGRVGFLGDKDFMEAPFSIITYTDKFITDQQAQDIQGVIARTDPAVFASGISGEALESYSIRGLASNVTDVTVNGLPGMAGYWRTSSEMFERVDVLKGPSALLNGMPPSGSSGGSVNLVTKRAGEEPLTRLTGTYMSDSQFGGHFDMGRRLGENKQFGVRLNGAYRNGDTAMNEQKKKVSQFSLGMDWLIDRVRVSADLWQGGEFGHGLTRGFTLLPGLSVPKPPKPGTSWNPPWSFFDLKEKGAMLRGESDPTGKLMVYAAAGISKSGIDTNMGLPQVFNQEGDFRINYSGVSERTERKSAEVGLKGKVHTGSVGHQFAVNATYYGQETRLGGFRNTLPTAWISNIYNPVWGAEVARPDHIPALLRTDMRLSSFGLADTVSFSQDRVQLTLGVRRQEVMNDIFNGTTGARMGQRYKESAITPAAAFLVKATNQMSVYANYMEGLSQGEVAPITASNAGEVFAPYKTKQKEVGIKFDLGEFAHTISLYEIKRPRSYTDPVTNVFSFGGEQRNRGVEWGGGRLTHKWCTHDGRYHLLGC